MAILRGAVLIGTALALNPAVTAVAQTALTVGELLDKGGKKVTKEEVVSLLTGATISGIQRERPQTKFQLTFKPDGSVTGSAINWATQTNYVTVSGKWSITEKGQFCRDLRNSFGNRPTGTDACTFWFSLGKTYYEAISEERGEVTYEREIKR